MKRNLPITNRERKCPEGTKLISSTNLKGIITYANDAFIEISGYSKEELIGKNHNIVRHPDMPPAAFQLLWDCLKEGKPWLGVVKNRSKNGDYYWVSAYVTPIKENGKVVGYESVRSCPTKDEVKNAEKLYSRLNKGKGITDFNRDILVSAVMGITASIGTISYFMGYDTVSFLTLLTGIVGIPSYLMIKNNSKLNKILERRLEFSPANLVSAKTYSELKGKYGLLDVMLKGRGVHIDTILNRISDSSMSLENKAQSNMLLTKDTHTEMLDQLDQNEVAVNSMKDIVASISELSENIARTSQQSEASEELAGNGLAVANKTRNSIEDLNQKVHTISDEVVRLSKAIQEIKEAASVIEDISSKTNLLALNAAIEAARAGEAGRGFSVVAEEVRNLSMKTHETTANIHEVLANLESQADHSVSIAQEGIEDANKGVQSVVKAEEMFSNIANSVQEINQMTIQMSAAIEEQAYVSKEINDRIEVIADSSRRTLTKNEEGLENLDEIGKVIHTLNETVERFK